MNATAISAEAVTRGVRWLARGLSLLLAGMVVMFFIGAGGFNRESWSAREAVQLAFFFTAWVGLLAAWRWELLGAALTLVGMLLFYAGNYLASGRWPGGAFPLFFIPGILFLACGLQARLASRRQLT
jgi:hypothetical protein